MNENLNEYRIDCIFYGGSIAGQIRSLERGARFYVANDTAVYRCSGRVLSASGATLAHRFTYLHHERMPVRAAQEAE